MAKQCESEADNSSDKALADAMWKSAKDLKAAAEQYKNAANAYYKDPQSAEARSGLDASGAALAAAVCQCLCLLARSAECSGIEFVPHDQCACFSDSICIQAGCKH
jgi:ferric-dicitrate binding protein FerR (iron transport regulator)